MTSFDGATLQAIGSIGELQTTSSEWYDHERVAFPSDASSPLLLFLPASCYLLAPTLLPPAKSGRGAQGPDAPAFAFSTEFGALLEPGENFGWQGYRATDATVADEGAPAQQDALAARLVRIQRLYGTEGAFASGTTSLCTIE